MKTRTIPFSLIAIGLLVVFLTASFAQTPAQKAEPEKKATPAAPPPPVAVQMPSLPPDRKAYGEAIRVTEPQKKIEALEKFIADFPDSFMVSGANQTILSTLVKNSPEQQERILAQARKTIATAQGPSRGSTYTSVVSTLIEGGILLDKAEEMAREGLIWVEDDEAKRTRQVRAPHLVNLGRLYLKRGKTREAEKALKEALAANPLLTDAAIGLAEVAEKKKDDKLALEYLTSAFLTGRTKPAGREKFYDMYRKTHNGTLNGLAETLDVRYRKDFPSPVTVEHYKPSPARTERTVLAEVFTGSGCPPCVAADLAFDAYLERYSRKDVAVIMYHLHIPLPDPMTNPSTEARSKFYAVNGVPSYVIDGEKNSGGGSREMTRDFYTRVMPTVEKRLMIQPDAAIKIDASPDAQGVKVSARVEGLKAESPKVKLQIVLVEDLLRYSGENGIRFHPMVVRSLAGPEAGGFVLDPAKPTSIDWRFDLTAITQTLKTHLDDFEAKRKDDKFAFVEKKHEIDASNLSVVAFVQEEESKKVLQTVVVKLKPSIASVER
jgi:tetratricopeptide (TPR) repeat protein